MRGLKHRYRVEDVPLLLMPGFLLYGYGIGVLLYLYSCLVRWSSAIVHEGRDQLPASPNHIFCGWHRDAWLTFVAFRYEPKQVWLANPVWYTKPVHVMLRLIGVCPVILGCTGRSGRAAADQLLLHLRAGASTTIAPDGPYGPAHVVKGGVLHLSAQSGVPIVPVQIALFGAIGELSVQAALRDPAISSSSAPSCSRWRHAIATAP